MERVEWPCALTWRSPALRGFIAQRPVDRRVGRMGFDAVDVVTMLPTYGTCVFANEGKAKFLDHSETGMVHWIHYSDDGQDDPRSHTNVHENK